MTRLLLGAAIVIEVVALQIALAVADLRDHHDHRHLGVVGVDEWDGGIWAPGSAIAVMEPGSLAVMLPGSGQREKWECYPQGHPERPILQFEYRTRRDGG